MMKRVRATAIVEYPQGILLTAIWQQGWLLPGGGVHAGESEHDAALRELFEETGLSSAASGFLFDHETQMYRHSVFWVDPIGVPTASAEIHELAYYAPGARLPRIAPVTAAILKRFYDHRERQGNDPGGRWPNQTE